MSIEKLKEDLKVLASELYKLKRDLKSAKRELSKYEYESGVPDHDYKRDSIKYEEWDKRRKKVEDIENIIIDLKQAARVRHLALGLSNNYIINRMEPYSVKGYDYHLVMDFLLKGTLKEYKLNEALKKFEAKEQAKRKLRKN